MESKSDIKKKSTREKVMDILSNNKGKHISGEEISEELGISRASVWKHINSIKKEGFEIESKTGKGYILKGKIGDSLTAYEIKNNLDTEFIGQNVEYFKTIDSTNTYAGKVAEKSPEGTVIVSDEQTAGKGRTGRTWVSKKREGIYFSTILKPDIPLMKASFLTQVAGAALVLSLNKTGVEAKIKWPNDIILGDKKIAGILTEMRAEIDRIFYIVVGIGINLYSTEFDKDIEEKATSLLNEGYRVDRKDVLKNFFVEFEKMYVDFLNGKIEDIIKILREKSVVLGREIYLVNVDDKKKVIAEDIDRDGNLVVKNEYGEHETVFTGEISIRGLDSYI